MTEMHDLVAPYALDSLEPDETVRFEQHLETCLSCRQELVALREGATTLAEAVAAPPPNRLKGAIFDAIGDAGSPTVLALKRGPRVEWIAAVAASAAAVVFFGMWATTSSQLDDAERIAAVYEASDAMTIEVSTDHGPARFVWSSDIGAGVFNGGSLVDVGDDQVYELWLITEDGAAGAGVLNAGDTAVLVDTVRPGQTFAMTVERAPGVEVSDQPPVFAVDL